MKPSISGRRISSCKPDPGAERIAADPALLGVGVHALQIVERGGGVGKLAHAVVEHALAAADAAEIEAQDAEAEVARRACRAGP